MECYNKLIINKSLRRISVYLEVNLSNLPSSKVVTVLLGLGLLEPKSLTAITLVVYCVAGFKKDILVYDKLPPIV